MITDLKPEERSLEWREVEHYASWADVPLRSRAHSR
jgi:hypothetical protein